MEILEKYKEYRRIQTYLHGKILDKCVSPDDIYRTAELFGVWKNNTIVLQADYENDAVYDFNVYEKVKDGKNSVSQYIELGEETTTQEDELLSVMVETSTSLYEVVECEKEKGLVVLKDVLSQSDENIMVRDIGISTINRKILLFTRLIHLDEFSMTTGLGYIFRENHKQYLLKRSKKLMKKINSGDPSIDRFLAFFQLNRLDGLPSLHEPIGQ